LLGLENILPWLLLNRGAGFVISYLKSSPIFYKWLDLPSAEGIYPWSTLCEGSLIPRFLGRVGGGG